MINKREIEMETRSSAEAFPRPLFCIGRQPDREQRGRYPRQRLRRILSSKVVERRRRLVRQTLHQRAVLERQRQQQVRLERQRQQQLQLERQRQQQLQLERQRQQQLQLERQRQQQLQLERQRQQQVRFRFRRDIMMYLADLFSHRNLPHVSNNDLTYVRQFLYQQSIFELQRQQQLQFPLARNNVLNLADPPDVNNNGLTPARIGKFKHFAADESLVGERCLVCMNDLEVGTPMVRLDCHVDHILCKTCVDTWFKDNKSCPTCRQVFK